MPKMKTKSGAKKRFRVRPGGTVKRGHHVAHVRLVHVGLAAQVALARRALLREDVALERLAARRFIAEDGDKGKVTLRFRGREITHQELGMRMLERIRDELADVAVVEHMPKLEGRQMIMVLAPKRK